MARHLIVVVSLLLVATNASAGWVLWGRDTLPNHDHTWTPVKEFDTLAACNAQVSIMVNMWTQFEGPTGGENWKPGEVLKMTGLEYTCFHDTVDPRLSKGR